MADSVFDIVHMRTGLNIPLLDNPIYEREILNATRLIKKGGFDHPS